MVEDISNGADALEIGRILRVVLKVLPQTHDEVIDGACRRLTGIPPAYLQQDLARQWFPPVCNKDPE